MGLDTKMPIETFPRTLRVQIMLTEGDYVMRDKNEIRVRTPILFLAARLPFPPRNGRAVCLNNYAKYLHYHCDCEVHMICITDREHQKFELPEYIASVKLLKRSSTILGALRFLVLRGTRPFQTTLYYSKRNLNLIESFIRARGIQTVFFDMIRSAEYLLRLKSSARKILDMDDIVSLRYENVLSHRQRKTMPIGPAAGPSLLFFLEILNRIRLTDALLRLETKILRRFEVTVSAAADDIVLVSRTEAKILKQMTGKNAIVAPIGVDVNELSPKNVPVIENLISFIGALDYPPNSDAMIYFITDIWSKIQESQPAAKLRILGGNPEQALLDICKRVESVSFIGTVPDHRSYIQESCVFVAPMRQGSGVNTKIIEAMAMGVPVVTTPLGAEGIVDYSPQSCPLIICDSSAKFADAVVRLIEDQQLRNKLSIEGIEYVRRWFDISRALKPLHEIVGSA